METADRVANETRFVITHYGPTVASGGMDPHFPGPPMFGIAEFIDASVALTYDAGVSVKPEEAAGRERPAGAPAKIADSSSCGSASHGDPGMKKRMETGYILPQQEDARSQKAYRLGCQRRTEELTGTCRAGTLSPAPVR